MKRAIEPDKFTKSDIEDAERTTRWLALRHDNPETAAGIMKENGEKEWIVKDKNIATAWYAAEILAPANGITCLSKAAKFGKFDQRFHACTCATKGDGKLRRTLIGASSWTDRRIAICFAFRNSIRQLLPQQPDTTEKVAYRSTLDQAINREA